MGKQALWGLFYMNCLNHALSGMNDAIIICERTSMPFCIEGVMGNDIQIVADITFDDDCLLFLCTPGIGVTMPNERASP